MSSALRSRMEDGFGGALPDVRIHTGSEAQATARREGVRAFAIGHDIGFDAGEFRPFTPMGDAVMAHELAHTMQAGPAPHGRARAGRAEAGGAATSTRHEAEADRAAGGVVGRLFGGKSGPAGPVHRPRQSAGLQLQGCAKAPSGTGAAPGQGLAPGLPAGTDTKSYTLDKYIEMWEKQQGRKMTDEEKKRLAAGCVGVTRTNLGGSTDETDCYATFEQAQKRAADMQAASGVKPFIFSKRFWSMGKSFPTAGGTGKVDMSNDTGDSPPGEVNFDYGWYDEKTNTWWHANHCDPVTGSDRCRESYGPGERMQVHQSTLAHYSDPNYFGADKQVFCVQYSKLK